MEAEQRTDEVGNPTNTSGTQRAEPALRFLLRTPDEYERLRAKGLVDDLPCVIRLGTNWQSAAGMAAEWESNNGCQRG